MNLKCLTKGPFIQLNKVVKDCYKKVAEFSMKTAAGEVVHIDTVSDIPCTHISVDGTWQKCGHSSLHGVVTAISGDKCLDVEIKSRH